MEDVREELDERGPLWVVWRERKPELQYGVGVITWTERAVSHAGSTRWHKGRVPWWTKKTASHTMRLSGEGATYMPNGQCPVWRKEAYSSETAVRVRGGTGRSLDTLAVLVFCLEDLALAGLERSSVGVGTRLESILEAIRQEGRDEIRDRSGRSRS